MDGNGNHTLYHSPDDMKLFKKTCRKTCLFNIRRSTSHQSLVLKHMPKAATHFQHLLVLLQAHPLAAHFVALHGGDGA